MKRYALVAVMLFLSGTFIKAQEGAPVAEIGLNYSFVHHHNEQGSNSFGMNGGSVDIAFDVNRTLGFVADLGGYDSGKFDRQAFSYLFGPRLNWRMSRVVPYVQFLFGGVDERGVLAADGTSTTQNGFATAAGGGIDINISRHIALRPIQVEYFMTQVPHLASNLNGVQNNLRYSAGLVLNFGAK
jgi:hypothetical protein